MASVPEIKTPEIVASDAPAEPPIELPRFQLALDQFPMQRVEVPKSIKVEVVSGPGRKVLRVSGGSLDASPSGKTGGVSVRVSDAFERAASGARIRVQVVVRAADRMRESEFLIAYSTCDVGNSGWQRMWAGAEFETFSFEWDVPEMLHGNGDFVGILPEQDSAIEIAEVAVSVVPPISIAADHAIISSIQEFNARWRELDRSYSTARRLLLGDPRWIYGPLNVKETVRPLIDLMGERLVGAMCCDTGCGVSNVLGNSTLLYLNGARGGYAFDLLEPHDLARSAEALYDLLAACLMLPDEYHINPRFSRDAFMSRVRDFDFKALLAGDLYNGARNVPIEHEARSIYDLPLDKGPFDLTFSRAVLEHIPDLGSALVRLFALTAPGGVHRHVVDFVDHRSYTSPQFNAWSFLTQGDDWAVGVPNADVSNRLRPSEVEACFSGARFAVKASPWPPEPAPMPDEVYDAIVEPFRKFPRAELETLLVTYLATKPG